jgi:hypothetical protein
LDEGDGFVWVDDEGPHAAWRLHLPAEKGPRTGTGVYNDGDEYIRVIDRRCRRADVRRAEDIAPRIETEGRELVYYV